MSANLAWYALHVRLHHERDVTSYIQQLGQEGFLPLSTASNGSRLVSPLFPGYTFCKMDWSNGPKLYHIPGFIRVVGAGKRPIPILNSEIETIKNITQSHLDCEPCPFGKRGTVVRLAKGPLAGVKGVIERADAKCIIVTVSLLRRSIAVAVDPGWIESVRAA